MRREHRARNELGVLPTSEERASAASAGDEVSGGDEVIDDFAARIQQARFTPVRLGDGYDMGEVDQLLEQVLVVLSDGRPVAPILDRARLTTTRWREGYRISEVDELLERLRVADRQPPARPRGVQVTIDCADPRALSTFWNAVLGYQFPPPPPGFESWDTFAESLPEQQRNMASASMNPVGVGPRLFFQQVPEPKAGKNRLHLDVRAAPGLEGEERMDALESEAARLVGLGAIRVERFEPHPPLEGGHIVMQDPEGNEFCLD